MTLQYLTREISERPEPDRPNDRFHGRIARNATPPVSVPSFRNCRPCFGTGCQPDSFDLCEACNGTGSTPCPDCGGEPTPGKRRCARCRRRRRMNRTLGQHGCGALLPEPQRIHGRRDPSPVRCGRVGRPGGGHFQCADCTELQVPDHATTL